MFRVGSKKKKDGRMIVNKHTFFFALYILVCFIYFIWPCWAKKKYSCDLCLRFPAENN